MEQFEVTERVVYETHDASGTIRREYAAGDVIGADEAAVLPSGLVRKVEKARSAAKQEA